MSKTWFSATNPGDGKLYIRGSREDFGYTFAGFYKDWRGEWRVTFSRTRAGASRDTLYVEPVTKSDKKPK